MTSEPADRKLSTSALAKALELPIQQLFTTLKDFGWITKIDDGWALTGKGEFEGGEYVHSKRFGRYIVWPRLLLEHPLMQSLESNRHLTASKLGRHFHLGGREVNRALAEMGWIRRTHHGWELTDSGRRHGGIRMESENSGTSYVVWPESIVKETVLIQQMVACGALHLEAGEEDDLFDGMHDAYCSLDGHQFDCVGKLRICQWLYLAGLLHACHRALPDDPALSCDFYLPLEQVHIDYWDAASSGAELNARLARRDLYQQRGLRFIEIEASELDHLDEVLGRQLRKLGVDFL